LAASLKAGTTQLIAGREVRGEGGGAMELLAATVVMQA
jgi:hypothetical protein